MKKIVIAVVILVLLLVVAPYGIGKIAEQRVNTGLDKFVEQAQVIKISERKWTSGWFTSEQEITFELAGPWLDTLKAIIKAKGEQVVNAPVPGDGAANGPDERALPEEPDTKSLVAKSPAGTPEAAPDAAATASAGESAAAAAAAAIDALPPMKLTVHNHIVHGPVLWFSAVGIARVDSKVVLSDEVRKLLVKNFGTDEPVKVSTRVAFFGGATTTFSGDGRSIDLPKGEGKFSYDAFKLSIGYASNFDNVDVTGSWPRFEFASASKGETVSIADMTLESKSKRIVGDLYSLDLDYEIGRVHIVGADKQVTEVAGAHYIVNSSVDGDFLSMSTKMGAGAVESPAMAQAGVVLKEVNYDLTFRRLHLDTLAKISADIKAAYGSNKALANSANATNVEEIFLPIKKHALELLNYDPELVLDRIGIVTPEGEGTIKGIIKLKGVTEQDFTAGGMALLAKIDADLTVDVPQKMVDKFPNGATASGSVVDGGYAKREGDHLVSKIEFKKGALTINGKPQGLPPLGGEPQPPPPQE